MGKEEEEKIYDLMRVNLTDWTFKGAVQVVDETVRIQMWSSNGSVFKRYLKERITFQMMSLRFSCKITGEAFDEKIQQLVTGGFISLFERETKTRIDPKNYEHLHFRGPKVLSMENLKAGFVVWITTVSFAILAFICEWAKRFLDYLIVKNLLKAFYQEMDSRTRKPRPIIKQSSKSDSLEDDCSQVDALEQNTEQESEVHNIENDSISAIFGERVNDTDI